MTGKEKLFIKTLLCFLGIISCGMGCMASYQESKTKKPNILLITACSLRQDHLGCYGYPRFTSPNIDKIAQTATIFMNCYTPIPWTLPGIKALMTGDYPFSLSYPNEEIFLTNMLHSKDYLLFGISSTIVEDNNFNLGFDKFFNPLNLKRNKDKGGVVDSDIIVNKAIELLDSSRAEGSPIFLWLLFKDAHWPYIPPDPYKKLFLDDQLYRKQFCPLMINADYHDSLGGIGEARLKNPAGNFIDNKAYYVAQYDSEIYFLDFNIGKLINYLKGIGHFDDWMIIFMADHGESMGEEGYFFDHGYKLSECLTRVPLIIKFPRQDKMKIRKELVSICDIYHTIAGLLKVKSKFIKPQAWGRNLFCNKGNRVIMMNNSPKHERLNEDFLGCILGQYKLIWDRTINKKELYRLDGQETLLTEYSDEQRNLINKLSVLIADFFFEQDKMKYHHDNDAVKLKALGYLQ